MTYIILAAFVIGVKVVIDGYADHFGIDLEKLYGFSQYDYEYKTSLLWRTIWKPIFWCNICMSSVWGTIGYLLMGWQGFGDWVLHCVVCAAIVSGVNWVRERV